MKIKEKFVNIIPKKHKPVIKKSLSVIRIVKNIVCWTLIAVLAFTLVTFLLTRISGGTPSFFGYTVHRISSGSMEPTLMVGDVILDKEMSDINEIREDDIITFQGGAQYNNNLVTHRVIRGPYSENGIVMLRTKGDANDVEDLPIYGDDVRSKFVTKINFLAGLYSFFLSPWGLITFISVLLIIFFDEIINIVRIISGHYDDEDDESISEIIERIKREEEEKKKAAIKIEEKNKVENESEE